MQNHQEDAFTLDLSDLELDSVHVLLQEDAYALPELGASNSSASGCNSCTCVQPQLQEA